VDQGIETTDNKISMLSPDVTPSEQQLWLQIETLFNGDRVKGPTFEVPVYNLFKILVSFPVKDTRTHSTPQFTGPLG